MYADDAAHWMDEEGQSEGHEVAVAAWPPTLPSTAVGSGKAM